MATTTVNVNVAAAGTSGQVQFNNGGAFGADSDFHWDNTNKRLGVGTPTPATRVDIQGIAATDSGVLGTELLTSTGWTTTGWTGNFVDGFQHTTGNTDVLSNTLAAVVNTYYQITYTITGRTAGSVTIAFGGQSVGSVTATGAFGPRATTTGNLTITPTSDFNGTIVISIRTISTYGATVTFKNSSGAVANEIRNHSINTNTFLGRVAGQRNTTGAENTFIGQSTGQNNTTGSRIVAIGTLAASSNTTGVESVYVGRAAGLNNTTGSNNSFVGNGAGQNNTTGSNNSFVGSSAGLKTTQQEVVTHSVGNNAGLNNTTGSSNSFFGNNAGLNNTTGSSNSFFGLNAGRFISGGGNLTIANNSVFLGFDTRAAADNETNQIVIGYQAIGTGSNSVTLGNTSITRTNLRGQVVISGFASAPTGVEGAIYYDSTTKKHYGFDGTTWNALY
jgi:trimeric autotransporter adhesin